MQLNLSPYQVPKPYPSVTNLEPDRNLADKILGGYCGGYSELTTVLQYAQHSLRCEAGYLEVSRTMRGIFYVETLHMECLGKCLCRLQNDCKYILKGPEFTLPWQASLVNYEEEPSRMLLSDIMGEKKAVQYYEQLAEEARQPELQNLLLRLAEDERLHVKILSSLYTKFFG